MSIPTASGSYSDLKQALNEAAYELLVARRKEKVADRDRLNEEIDRYDDQIEKMELQQQEAA